LATSLAGGASYYIYDHTTAVFAARRAGAMILAQATAFAFDETGCGKSMMAPALS
jgi:hypothetical protein